ncbi:hypothetical protein LTR33_015008, partial [Friedmanniomyces endolithicus]
HNNSNPSSANPCASNTSCLNGGASVASTDGSCHCVCVNGFTGSTCTIASAASCTTASVGSTNDATVGTAIPRLLQGAQGNFSVPLDGQALLGLFAEQNMSCHSENALVTFGNSAGTRRGLGEEDAGEGEEVVGVVEPTPTVRKRQTATTGSDGAATSNGIIYETGAPSSSTPAASASASATPSSSSSTTNTNPNSTTTQDFARVAILYVLQSSGQLSTAATAQEELQSYFSSGRTTEGQEVNPANLTLGGRFTCDLGGWRIGVGNGTVVGGGG